MECTACQFLAINTFKRIDQREINFLKMKEVHVLINLEKFASKF